MLFFYKLVQETQMSTPPEATRCQNLTKLLILLPLRDNSKSTFQCETPCNIVPGEQLAGLITSDRQLSNAP